MKKSLFFSFLLAAGLLASAQTQGYKDGIEYYKAGQYDNAKTILERTINDQATDQALANYYLGQVSLAKGDKTAAKAYFDKGLNLNPENAYNYVGLGALDLLNGNEDAAKKNFDTAKKMAKKEKNADALVAVARAYYNADAFKYSKETQAYLTEARKLSKNQEPAIYILEGDMLSDAQDYGSAAAKYENAIFNDPTNSEGYVKYANAYFYVNKNYGIQKLEELLKQQPNSAMAQRELAEKYFKADHWKKASDLYGEYIKNPNHFPEDKARYAVLLYWGEKYPQSLQVANEILAQDPSNFLMQRIRFLNQTELKEYQAAADNAAKFFAGNPGAHFTTKDFTTYADALIGLGQDSLAIVQYELAAKNDPENGDLLKNLSSVYNQNKQYAKGADAYAAYLEMQENPSPDDFYGMATRYLQAAGASTDTIQARELADKGIVYIKKVIDNPNIKPMAQFYQRLAFLNIAGNNKQPNAESIEALNKMIELLDQDPANKDPQNSNNQLNLYKNAYAFMQAYYSRLKDTENFEKAVALYKEINELINPTPAN